MNESVTLTVLYKMLNFKQLYTEVALNNFDYSFLLYS